MVLKARLREWHYYQHDSWEGAQMRVGPRIGVPGPGSPALNRAPLGATEEAPMDEPDYTRQAVLEMLANGYCTLAEAAELAGTSRQLVRYWAKMANVDAGKARKRLLLMMWRETLKRSR